MFKKVNGITINYEVKGQGEETIIFVHGLGGSLNIWNSQVNICSRYFKTITYDLRGSGRSEVSTNEYSIELWVEDLKALLDSENVGQAHLVGWSLGTLIVQHFAITHPEMVLSQSLVGPLWEIPETGKTNLYKRADLVEQEGMDAVADTIIDGGVSPYSKHGQTALVGLIRELLQRNDKRAYAATCKALADGKAINHQDVQAPTLLIVGDGDNTAPVPVATRLLNHFPNAKLEVISNSGHWTTVEKPQEVNQLLLRFLQTANQSQTVRV
ncbi:alpha/beta fold hydrolase [Peribacillus cavernae]|uniref:Alpha/beta fold hydrolase n=1 Tax=Peribacillus cavernae TaxID=1674310 RepID=A0A3S0VIJ0_9BACI|nr:alpha/beta hydrolase [Peribacillus cavernae]MDQ0221260.1 3-oxoadipate enol-lactonase [Peribacillus cavernae]RUQ25112.1 alpha/beta fold hydrolase [Peribacillus cavernae]